MPLLGSVILEPAEPPVDVPLSPQAAAVAVAVSVATIVGPAASAPFYTPPSVPPAQYVSPGQQAVQVAALVQSGAPLPSDVIPSAPAPSPPEPSPPEPTAPTPIPQPGEAVDADAEADAALAAADANDPDLSNLAPFSLDDPFAEGPLVAVKLPLKGTAAADSINHWCAVYDVDPLACDANVLNEGSSGKIGDSGNAYGPWQIHLTDGRLPQFQNKGPNDDAINEWAWTDNGIKYAVLHMATSKPSAKGLVGVNAVAAIVKGFERPADIHGATVTRIATYKKLVALDQGAYAYVSSQLLGPVSGSAVGAVPSGGTSSDSGTYQPAGVASTWRSMLDVFATGVPKQHDNVKAIGDSIMGAVK